MEEAISDYRHAMELNPNNAYAYANLGAVLLLQGKFDEAIEVCEKALRLRQDQAETHAALAAAYWSRDRAEESFLHNRKALELDPNLFDARFNLGWDTLQNGPQRRGNCSFGTRSSTET
jgi:tetratricopeptide (TPR) repeat protein